MTIHTEDQLQEPQAEPKATPAKRPARTAKNAPAGESQPKPRPARKKPQRAQPEPVQESAPEPAAVAELVTGIVRPLLRTVPGNLLRRPRRRSG